MQEGTRTMEQDVDTLEKAIIKRIDAIFDHEVPENRFVRSSPEGEQQNSVVAVTDEFVGRLESFLNSISARRKELKGIMDRLPSSGNLDRIKGQDLLREVEGLVDAIQQVGWSAETALKQVLGLTRQMLEGITPR